MYYDLHTHKISEENSDIFSVVNISGGDSLLKETAEGSLNTFYSIGIHPWYIKKENLHKELDLIEKYMSFPKVTMLGECGLDKLCKTDFELQKEAFLSQILISEKNNKPLLIHCVKSFDEIIALRKKYSPKQAWIIHGFRGKAQQVKQLTDNGFFLSFGFNCNEESIKNIPIEKLLFETDNSGHDIRSIYKKAAEILETSVEKLIDEVEANVRTFIKLPPRLT